MPLIKDLWFPNGALIENFASIATYGVQYTPGTLAVQAIPEVLERISYCIAPDGSGERVVRMLTKATDPVGELFSKRTQFIVERTNAERAQITNWAGKEDSRRWYRWKVMLSPGFIFEKFYGETDNRLILWQVHDKADTSDYVTTPPIWQQLKADGYFWFDVTSCPDELTTISPVNYTRRKIGKAKLIPGVPAEFVMYAKFAYDNTGEITIWKDRRKIWEETGMPNCFNNHEDRGGGPMYNVLNCYCTNDQIDRLVYHWGSQIGDEEYTSFDSFMAACGTNITELEPFATSGMSFMAG